jgi:hypothetical protein
MILTGKGPTIADQPYTRTEIWILRCSILRIAVVSNSINGMCAVFGIWSLVLSCSFQLDFLQSHSFWMTPDSQYLSRSFISTALAAPPERKEWSNRRITSRNEGLSICLHIFQWAKNVLSDVQLRISTIYDGHLQSVLNHVSRTG